MDKATGRLKMDHSSPSQCRAGTIMHFDPFTSGQQSFYYHTLPLLAYMTCIESALHFFIYISHLLGLFLLLLFLLHCGKQSASALGFQILTFTSVKEMGLISVFHSQHEHF